MKIQIIFIVSVVTFMVLLVGFFTLSPRYRYELVSDIDEVALWQRMAAPGELSQAHAFLENNCTACHTPHKGVEAKNCMVCHADNKSLLQRQPTAFHANIVACAACHLEHQGRVASTTKMDHVALAHIGLKQLKSELPNTKPKVAQIKRWLEQSSDVTQLTAAHLRPEEALLNCATCHQTKDRHRGQFGMDCAQCHATEKWTIAEYRHPSSASQSCAQCHQAPPSHNMMHFKMVSMKVAGQEHANVAQCFLCHQTTSWNDIKGVGWYKHH